MAWWTQARLKLSLDYLFLFQSAECKTLPDGIHMTESIYHRLSM